MIVLDTHAWLWWRDSPERLSADAREAIDAADLIAVSSISAWELATLVRLGRIELDREVGVWVRQALAHPRLEARAVTPGLAVEAGSLGPGFPGDPADRIIYATARRERAPLVTRDSALRDLDERLTVW